MTLRRISITVSMGQIKLEHIKIGLILKKIHQELEIVLGKNGKMWSKNAALILNQFQAKLSPIDRDKIRKIAEYEKSLKAKISVLIDKDYYPDSFYRKIRFIAELLCNTL